MRKILFFIILCCVGISCENKEVDTAQLASNGKEYFPLSMGRYAIYNANRKDRVPGGYQISDYQIKELITDSTIESGDTVFRIERFTRADANQVWPAQPDSVWTARISKNRAIRTESNVAFIKLVFPVKNSKTWNGNSLNSYEAETYVMRNVGKPFSYSTYNYPETVLVVQKSDTNNLVQRVLREEVYAKNVGLVYKRSEFLNLDFTTGDTTSGYIYTQKLIESGK